MSSARPLYDMAVLGGGIIGCFSALRAAELGASVVLIDERGVFKGASTRAAGVFTVQLDSPLDVELVAKSIELVKKYSKKAWVETGFLQIGKEQALQDSIDALTHCDISFQLLDHREIMERWPDFIVEQDLMGVYTVSDLSVEPGILGYELKEELAGRGVNVLEGVKARVIEIDKDGLRLVKLENAPPVTANFYMLATGSWTKELLRTCHLDLETFLLTCFAYRLEMGKPLRVPSFSDEYFHTYWRPWETTLVGGRYDAEFSDTPDLTDAKPPIRSLRMSLKLLLRRFKIDTQPQPVEYMRGPCSFTNDGLPIFGPITGMDNAFIIDGLGGYGLMRGPALGYLAADALLRKNDEIVERYRAFSPSRLLKRRVEK